MEDGVPEDQQQRSAEDPASAGAFVTDDAGSPDDGPGDADEAAGEGSAPATDPAGDDGPISLDPLQDIPDGELPVEELIVERPLEAMAPMRRPSALLGTLVTGGVMGMAEVVPGFSGGTVALVAGIYERLIANIRQGARTLSLLVRARPRDAWHSLRLIDWVFVAVLGIGMLGVLFTVVGPLSVLLETRPVEMSAVFLGLVLGAAVVAGRRLREGRPWHVLVVLGAAAVSFIGLGFAPGTIEEPNLLFIMAGGAIAISAWILPGVSGSFMLLIMGLYPTIIAAAADRDLGILIVFGIGTLLGLAAFSTFLNWLLARAHDVVLAALIGLMVGSVRVLWPWPSEAGVGGSAELGAPVGSEAFLALALGLTAFSLLYMGGLAASAVQRYRTRWVERRALRRAEHEQPQREQPEWEQSGREQP
jgi:putative membrane protein